MAQRGRPPKVEHELTDRIVYHLDFKDEDGVITRWKFNRNISKNGPVEVEAIYPKTHPLYLEKQIEEQLLETQVIHHKKKEKKQRDPNKPLPKSSQKYLNPATGKMVCYVRARALGLV